MMISVSDVPAAIYDMWLVYTVKQQTDTSQWRGSGVLSVGAAGWRGVPFKWCWRNTAVAGGRGRCHRLWPVSVRPAVAARCLSSCCRKSPRSSDSGAAGRPECCCSLIRGIECLTSRGQTFLLEMENSFSHSLHWLASLSFNQTWPPWNKQCHLTLCLNLLLQHQRYCRYSTWRALLASLMSSIFIFDLMTKKKKN